ncbi:MAG: hypothetical protein IT308_08130 [Anaerolineaceae bacterium]|nr:hypothetical protein [Anaerolineaceae bacterium]
MQRCQRKTCGKTFTETKRTIFCHKHAKEEHILEVLALLTEQSERLFDLQAVAQRENQPIAAARAPRNASIENITLE